VLALYFVAHGGAGEMRCVLGRRSMCSRTCWRARLRGRPDSNWVPAVEIRSGNHSMGSGGCRHSLYADKERVWVQERSDTKGPYSHHALSPYLMMSLISSPRIKAGRPLTNPFSRLDPSWRLCWKRDTWAHYSHSIQIMSMSF